MEIRSLAGTDFGTLYEAFAQAFAQAFADYEIHPGREELNKMLRRRGFAPELSFAAFDGKKTLNRSQRPLSCVFFAKTNYFNIVS